MKKNWTSLFAKNIQTDLTKSHLFSQHFFMLCFIFPFFCKKSIFSKIRMYTSKRAHWISSAVYYTCVKLFKWSLNKHINLFFKEYWNFERGFCFNLKLASLKIFRNQAESKWTTLFASRIAAKLRTPRVAQHQSYLCPVLQGRAALSTVMRQLFNFFFFFTSLSLSKGVQNEVRIISSVSKLRHVEGASWPCTLPSSHQSDSEIWFPLFCFAVLSFSSANYKNGRPLSRP